MLSTLKMTWKYAEDGMYITKGMYGKNTEEATFVKEGDNKPFVKDGNNEPLAKNGNWAGCDDEPLATRAIDPIHRAR